MCVQQKTLSDSLILVMKRLFSFELGIKSQLLYITHHANRRFELIFIFGGLVFPKELPFSGSDFAATETNSKPQNLSSDLPKILCSWVKLRFIF